MCIRDRADTLLKRYDEAAADIDAWQKAFTKNTQTLSKETINDFYAQLKYYTPEAPTVKKELHPDFVIEKGMQENLIHCILPVSYTHLDVYKRQIPAHTPNFRFNASSTMKLPIKPLAPVIKTLSIITSLVLHEY